MLMTSVSGHLMEMDFTEEHRKWNSCEPLSLFDAPVRKVIPQVRIGEHDQDFRVSAKLRLFFFLECVFYMVSLVDVSVL